MKMFLFLCSFIALSTQSFAESSRFSPVGRAIVDRRTGETLEFVCLEEFNEQTPCTRLQLRKNGSELIGIEIRVRTFPAEEFKAHISAEVADHYESTKWKKRKSWYRHLVKKGGVIESDVVVVGHLGYFIGSIIVAFHFTQGNVAIPALDFLFAGGQFVAGTGAFAVLFVGVPAAIFGSEALIKKAVPSIQHGMVNLKRKKATRKVNAAIDAIFGESEITEDAILMKSRHFQLLKNGLERLVSPAPNEGKRYE